MQPPRIQPGDLRPADWFALNPVAIAAVGRPARPGDRLIGLRLPRPTGRALANR